MTKDEINASLNDILELFKNHPECEEKINAILSEMKNSSGFDGGSIREIIDRFRTNGMIFASDVSNESSQAGTAVAGVPSVSLSPRETQELTAKILMGEIIHWAGMVHPITGAFPPPPLFPGPIVVTDYYPDAAIAEAGNKVGLNMTVQQYRRTYPDIVARDRSRWGGSDLAANPMAISRNLPSHNER
jgi:hypothetical protein